MSTWRTLPIILPLAAALACAAPGCTGNDRDDNEDAGPDCVDNDNDFSCEGVDCDDANPEAYPGAPELPDNQVDDDCDGEVDEPGGDADTDTDADDDTDTDAD